MKIMKIITSILVLGALVFFSYGCSSNSAASTAKTQTATVKIGTIMIEVTGTGNLAYSTTENLAFEIAGTVESVLVTAGESVLEGQELVRLDTAAWEDQIKTLEKGLTTAQRNLINAQRQVVAKGLALRQAELNVQTSEDSLDEIAVVRAARELVDVAESSLQTARVQYALDPSTWGPQIEFLNLQLKQAQQNLEEILSGTSYSVTGDIYLQIEKKLLQIEQSKMELEDAEAAVENAVSAVSDAEQAVNDAQLSLDTANGLSPVITAPFTGFITKVNVSGGDDVQKGTVAVQIADPDRFEANIQVTEQDIFSVQLGGNAMVAVDALSDISFPATITTIAPLATVSQGVVSYKVTVELIPLLTPGKSENTTALSGEESPFPSPGTTGYSLYQNIQLKDGLSATITIIVQQASNVLVAPSRAISRQGLNYTVQVSDGTSTESRTVKIGITDGSYTEITEGLSEGEQIVYTTGSSSSSGSSSNSQQGMPQQIMPNMGGSPPGGF
jgi:HlyD family secretion protein